MSIFAFVLETRNERPRRIGIWAALLLVAASCAQERARPDPEAQCPTWKEDVAEPLADACGECHGGDEPDAGYDLSSYEGAIAPGRGGEPNAVAGDPSSPILGAVDPERAGAPHHEVADADLFATLEKWVVGCDLSYVSSRIHEAGLMNPRDSDFHGTVLRDLGWDFGACADCHGEEFEGGVSEVSCTSCHVEGPTECVTCHGDLGDTPPHAVHLGEGPVAGGYPCQACHPTPTDYRDPGHLFGPDGEVLSDPVQVELVSLANHTPPEGEREASAAFDRETRTCTDVYCHGDVSADPAASLTAPAWTKAPGQATCGTCHGDPPADHASARCGHCHPTLPRDGSGELDLGLHVDGAVDLRGEGACSGCHGDGELGAPPPALSGATSTEVLGVGAHRAHLNAPRGLSAPIPCEACHIVPDELQSSDHIDTPLPAEVFAAGHDSLAYAGGAEPAWEREAATCSDVYCHGGGSLSGDAAAGINRTPVWTAVGEDEATCGSCHGIPPLDDDHEPDFGLRDCQACHEDTVDAFGNIIVTGPPGERTSAHIDGEIDAF